jgi:hypothetical protein
MRVHAELKHVIALTNPLMRPAIFRKRIFGTIIKPGIIIKPETLQLQSGVYLILNFYTCTQNS